MRAVDLISGTPERVEGPCFICRRGRKFKWKTVSPERKTREL